MSTPFHESSCKSGCGLSKLLCVCACVNASTPLPCHARHIIENHIDLGSLNQPSNSSRSYNIQWNESMNAAHADSNHESSRMKIVSTSSNDPTNCFQPILQARHQWLSFHRVLRLRSCLLKPPWHSSISNIQTLCMWLIFKRNQL